MEKDRQSEYVFVITPILTTFNTVKIFGYGCIG
jgi:hypothetical protein